MKKPSPAKVAEKHLKAGKTPSWWKALVGRQKGLFYRGVPASGRGSGLGALGEGLYITWEKGIAGFYANSQGNPRGKKGYLYPYKIPASLKMMDEYSDDFGQIKEEMGLRRKDYSDSPMYARVLTMKAKELGYDGIVSSDLATGAVIFNPSKAKLVSKVPMSDVVWG